MITIRFNWPSLLIILLALAVWLIRVSDTPPARSPGKSRPGPRAPRRPTRAARPGVIIDMPAGDSRADYDAETERLDREAAEAVSRDHVLHSARAYAMPRGAWQEQ